MRRLFCLALTLACFSEPAFAAWAEYVRPDLGYRLQFPAATVESTGSYTTITADKAATHNVTARTATGIFNATVVDFFDRERDGASLMNEAEFFLRLLGDVPAVSTSRLPPGKRAIFGRFITIDMHHGVPPEQPGQTEAAHKWFKEATGLDTTKDVPEGSRMTVNMFFHHGRLYLFQGIALPSADSPQSPEPLRFVQSLDWTGEAGGEGAAAGGGNLPGAAAGGR